MVSLQTVLSFSLSFKGILALKRLPRVNPVSLWAGLKHTQML